MALSPEYIAGLFDGEGMVSISWIKRRAWKTDPTKVVYGFKMQTGIANSHRHVLELVQAQLGGYISKPNKRPKAHHRDVYGWRVVARDPMIAFLRTVQPFAIIKQEAIALGLEYLTTAGNLGERINQPQWETRLRIYNRLREINYRANQRNGPGPRMIASPGFNPATFYSPEELLTRMAIVRGYKK